MTHKDSHVLRIISLVEQSQKSFITHRHNLLTRSLFWQLATQPQEDGEDFRGTTFDIVNFID
jgi:hypothetical protein